MSWLRDRGKTVNFVDKFKDPNFIPDDETWYTDTLEILVRRADIRN